MVNKSGQVLYINSHHKSHLMSSSMLNLQQKALQHSCHNVPRSRPMLSNFLCKFMKIVDHIHQDSITEIGSEKCQ